MKTERTIEFEIDVCVSRSKANKIVDGIRRVLEDRLYKGGIPYRMNKYGVRRSDEDSKA